MKFSFENLHRNHKFAFLDGLLCGIALAYMARKTWEAYQEDKATRALWTDEDIKLLSNN